MSVHIIDCTKWQKWKDGKPHSDGKKSVDLEKMLKDGKIRINHDYADKRVKFARKVSK